MGKDKLKRFKENETFGNVFQPKFDEVFRTEYFMKGKWRTEYFKNNNPLVLELGCGKGEYTVSLAQKNKDVNYIGIDIKGARLWRGAKTAVEQNLRNVAFVRSSIELIESVFDADEVDEIWLTFSDPQPKKPKKRLSSANFLNKYKNFIKQNGKIRVKTDNQMLYEYSCAVAELNNFNIIRSSADVYNDDNLPVEVTDIQTFYEKRFLAEGSKIHYLEYEINNDIEIVEAEEPEMD